MTGKPCSDGYIFSGFKRKIRWRTLRLIQVKKRYVKTKCRKHNTKYPSYGFTNICVIGEEWPKCLLCKRILAVDSMKPNKLKRHGETMHAACVRKRPPPPSPIIIIIIIIMST
jgi:hypothetical protein